MLRIPCPHCGLRDEIEFRYRGDASFPRPDANAPPEAQMAATYERANPKGWHREYWLHASGCRQVIRLVRHTVTHQIAAAGPVGAIMTLPGEEGAP